MTYFSEVLDVGRHDLGAFRCANGTLNTWLQSWAVRAHNQDTGRTWVWHDGDFRVVAYFTLAAHMLSRAETRDGQGSVPGDLPATLLAKLALTQDLQGRPEKFGTHLLTDAVMRCVTSSETVASRHLVVDAIDENAEGFYVRHGFMKIPESRRLYVRVSDIREVLSQT